MDACCSSSRLLCFRVLLKWRTEPDCTLHSTTRTYTMFANKLHAAGTKGKLYQQCEKALWRSFAECCKAIRTIWNPAYDRYVHHAVGKIVVCIPSSSSDGEVTTLQS